MKMKTYSEILELLKKENIVSADTQIVISMNYALDSLDRDTNVTSFEFNRICDFAKEIYDELDFPNVATIVDVVADCYFDLGYGYMNKKTKIESLDDGLDLETRDAIIDEVIKIDIERG